MNDTILNPRQKLILEFVESSNGVSRRKIRDKLPTHVEVSIPTIARDLGLLLVKGLVRMEGKGPATRYYPLNKNPLLRFVDIDDYFSRDPDERGGAKETFVFDIFKNLNGLFSLVEIRELTRVSKDFSKESKKVTKDVFLKELERFTIELSWKSSKIEGNTYSLLDTETLIKQKIEAPGHPKEEAIMILNHKRAFESILENRREYKNITLSKITQLHNFIVKGLNINTGIRTQAVGVTGTVYQPPDNQWQIKEALEKLIIAVNKVRYPLEKALIILAMTSYIQPFVDGNKRTARMLANAVLLAHDLYPLSYRSVDETYYKKALVLFYEQNTLHYLKKIVVEQYKFALNTYFK